MQSLCLCYVKYFIYEEVETTNVEVQALRNWKNIIVKQKHTQQVNEKNKKKNEKWDDWSEKLDIAMTGFSPKNRFSLCGESVKSSF